MALCKTLSDDKSPNRQGLLGGWGDGQEATGSRYSGSRYG